MSSLIPVVGIDWATKPKNRALARLQFDSRTTSISVDDIVSPLPDEKMEQVFADQSVAVIGVDIPFGWPTECVDFIRGWSASKRPVDIHLPSGKHYSYRTTDLIVQKALGKWPLSVSSDRIGLGAPDWAGFVLRHDLQQRIDCGFGTATAGAPIIEVYPAATLAALKKTDDKLISQGYKQDPGVRATLLDVLFRSFKVTCSDEHRKQLVSVGKVSDLTDAFIAALTALIYTGVLGRSVRRPKEEEAETAQREGWIFFPT